MNDRLQLHYELVDLIGNNKVYYQPSENVKLSYPCIVYTLDGSVNYHADNKHYRRVNDYSVTLITKNPEDPLIDQMQDELDYISFGRHFVADNLHHYQFNVKRNHFDND